MITFLTGVVVGIVSFAGSFFGTQQIFDNQPQTFGAFGDPFLSIQLAASPSNGNCLTTNGTDNAWGSCGSGGGGAFLFSADTNYNTLVYSTSTPTLWFKSGFYASSTSQIVYASTTAVSAASVCLTGDTCRTTWPTSGSNAFEVATTSDIAISQLSYFSKTAGRTTLASVATTTLTATSPLSLDNPVVKVGGSNSVLSIATTTNNLFSGIGGQILAYTNGTGYLPVSTSSINVGTASALLANGANCSAGNFPLGVDASGAVETCTDAWTEAENTSANYEQALTAGDALTRTGDDFDFDGGTAPGGELGNTWASPTVDAEIFAFDELSDVNAITENFGDLVYWNGTVWADHATSTLFGAGSTPGYVLTFSNGAWTPAATSTCVQITGSSALCDGDDAAGAGAFPFTPDVYGGVANNSTTTGIFAKPSSGYGLIASSTFTTFASSTQSTVASNLWVGSGTTGDMAVKFGLSDTGHGWAMGLDDSDSDNFVISSSTSLGTSNAFKITSETLATTLGGSLTVTGAILPSSNDVGALGVSGTAWADLFLASGGVINWDAGDVLITHAANALTFTGVTANYKFDDTIQPNADDGGALGISGTEFSDLFLNTGGVINFEAGNYTVTHSAGLLTFSGGVTATAGTVTLATVAGAVDLGGATSLEIPNAASPTIDAIGEIALDTTQNQLLLGTSTNSSFPAVIPTRQYPAFSYATSTAWTGTTTLQLGPAIVGETWVSAMCYTNAGSLFVKFSDQTNKMNDIKVTSTSGLATSTNSNNTFTAGEKRQVEVGTPASSPTSIACTVSKYETRQ